MTWLVGSDQSAATELFMGNFGAAVVSDQAVAVGVTAVPTPATDRGSDLFFLLETWPGSVSLIGTSWSENHTPREIDSKAMRKVEGDQDIVFTAEAGLTGNGLTMQAVGRLLIKLH